MSDVLTPRARRRFETTNEILDAAWRLARRDGLASISMRDLGREVGLRAQSLYAYFESKAALYDAMFRQGQEQLAELTADWPADLSDGDIRVTAKRLVRQFVDFCTSDAVRYQLLFQRVVPGWEPTPETFDLAVARVDDLRRLLASIGIASDEAVDLWTAIVTGLTDQQISNDPGGDRWSRLTGRAVDMFLDHFGIDGPPAEHEGAAMSTAEPVMSGDLVAVGSHHDWMPLARDAYQRLTDEFASLEADDWARPTPCEGWTVRDLGGHLVGAMRAAARLRETVSQQLAVSRRTKRTGEAEVDALTAIQIQRAAGLTPQQVTAELQSLVEPAVRGRSQMPAFLRRAVRFHVAMGALHEKWTLDYFLGCILTRDAWLHRIDLADALGVAPTLDEHDRAIVGDVAVEWARRHAQLAELTLTGTAGGRLSNGDGGHQLTLDAVEFCRVVSGRSKHPHPLLAQQVPF